MSAEGSTPLIAIVKTVSEFCNLRCRYCYYRYLDQSQPRVMSECVLRSTLEQIYRWSQGPVRIVWHGGEPLLASLDFFEKAVAIQAELNPPRSQPVPASLQTNGILLNKSWARFFARHHISVGVSIDGPQDLHDAQRVDTGGHGTYRKVMRGVDALRSEGVHPGAVCVVHLGNIKEPERVYDGLVNAGFTSFHFKAMYETCNGNPGIGSVSGDEYAEFLLRVFRKWAATDDPNIVVGNFYSILKGLLGGRPGLCEHAGQCTSFVTIDWDGKIGACDAFPKNSFEFGAVSKGDGLHEYRMTSSFSEFASGIAHAQDHCRECEFFNVCAGGCFKYSYDTATRLWEHSRFCLSKKVLFRELLQYAKTGKIEPLDPITGVRTRSEIEEAMPQMPKLVQIQSASLPMPVF